jgi:uncharacterized protein
MRTIAFLLLMMFSLTVFARAQTPSPDAGIAQALPMKSLTVVSGHKNHAFKVMIARTAAEQEVGMMWQLAVKPHEGMLFPFPTARPAAFWMKNTLIPLDIIFIRKDGRIANIAANAVPQSLEPIPAAGMVSAVLEIGGGQAAQLGLKPGDRVRW